MTSAAPIAWRKVGHLSPSRTIETDAHEFYHLMPEGIVLAMTSLSLRALTLEEAEAARGRVAEACARLVEHGVEAIAQGGVPVVVTAGYEHEKGWIADMTRECGVPFFTATSPIVEALGRLSARRLAIVTPWEEGINALVAQYFVDAGFDVLGSRTPKRTLDEIYAASLNDEVRLADQLARSVLAENPSADTLLILGPQWPTSRLVQPLEDEFGKTVITTTHARVWKYCQVLGLTSPIEGRGRLLAGN